MLNLRDRLSHVYFLGGSPCSGKSSAAEALSHRFGLNYYKCDDAFYRHAESIQPHTHPTFYRVMHFSCEELWLRPVEDMLADELVIYREEFPMILADLLALPAETPVLAEGAALLPELVAPLLRSSRRAMWMVPTPAFQVGHYSQREWAKGVVKDCSDPERAFRNWMERDKRFAVEVIRQAGQLDLRVLVVDGSRSVEENTALVQEHFEING